jgi:uncharacterized protein YprB with RNaseH-like and TPR domain
METKVYCILDIETAGGRLDEIPAGFQLLFTGIKEGLDYRFYDASGDQLARLADFLWLFPGVVVTFNGTRFDLPILDEHLRRILGRPLYLQAHFDLLAEVVRATGYRISLADLALLNLGRSKEAWDHSRNTQLWQTTPQLLLDYNRTDLDLTAGLFERVVRGEALYLRNGRNIWLHYPC